MKFLILFLLTINIAIADIYLSIDIPKESNIISVPIIKQEVGTYNVKGVLNDYIEVEFLLDTGASLSSINRGIIEKLQLQGKARYIKEITARLADGTIVGLSLFNINSLSIGGNCLIQNIDVTVFPNKTKNIIGISTLEIVSPFTISAEPPSLILENCQ